MATTGIYPQPTTAYAAGGDVFDVGEDGSSTGKVPLPSDYPSAREIWETLSKINVNEHTQKVGRFTYLSWAWAWGTLKKHYPQAMYQIGEEEYHPPLTHNTAKHADHTVMVNVHVSIGSTSHSMWLPVMDNRNNAIVNPNSRQVSDANMRCLVKAIAMLGLGFYIYAGEGIPEAEKEVDAAARAADVKRANPKGKPNPPSQLQAPLSDNEINLFNAIETTMRSFLPDCDTQEALFEFWTEPNNKEALTKMETRDPDHFKKVRDMFTARKKEITDNAKETI